MASYDTTQATSQIVELLKSKKMTLFSKLPVYVSKNGQNGDLNKVHANLSLQPKDSALAIEFFKTKSGKEIGVTIAEGKLLLVELSTM